MINWTNDLSIWDLGLALLPILGIFIESKFNIYLRIKKVWHKILNSDSEFKVNLIFKSNISFSEIKHKLSKALKEKYGKLNTHKDSETIYDVMVDNSFSITLYNTNDELSLITSKIKCGIRFIQKELNDFLTVIDTFQTEVHKTKNNKIQDKESNIKLFLPYQTTYAKVYPPKGVKLEDYEIKLNDTEYASIVKLKLSTMEVYVNKTRKMESTIKKLI